MRCVKDVRRSATEDPNGALLSSNLLKFHPRLSISLLDCARNLLSRPVQITPRECTHPAAVLSWCYQVVSVTLIIHAPFLSCSAPQRMVDGLTPTTFTYGAVLRALDASNLHRCAPAIFADMESDVLSGRLVSGSSGGSTHHR